MNPNRRRKGIIKAKRVYKVWKQMDMMFEDEDSFIRSHLKNRKKCSCGMCCNARRPKKGKKHQKFPTRQEKEVDRTMKEDIEDLNNE